MSSLELDPITQPLSVLAFGPGGFDERDPHLLLALAQADLVVAVGAVNLERVAKMLPAGKTALCVVGGADRPTPPPHPFVGLHGRGHVLHGWRISGISGSPLAAVDGGFVLGDAAVAALLERTPACELLLSATPPSGYEAEIGDLPSYRSLAAWSEEAPPFYHVFGHPQTVVAGVNAKGTMLVGVHSWLMLPRLDFGV